MLKNFKLYNSKENKLYNNILLLSRNRIFYTKFNLSDTFKNRIYLIFIHISFLFIKIKQNKDNDVYKTFFQKIFDLLFYKIELNIREIGYGDVSVNKNMKNYINLFYNILETADIWEKLNKHDQQKVFLKYLNIRCNNTKIMNYFEKYLNYLKNNTFNSLLKGVIKLNF